MDQQDALVCSLSRPNRRIKRVGTATLGLIALGLFAAMACQSGETAGVRNSVADRDGEVVAAYQSDGDATLSVQETIVIKAGHLLNSETGSFDSNRVVVIKDGRIQSVTETVPRGARVIDLTDAYVLPGLIDAHTHVTENLWDDDYYENLFRKSPIDRAVMAHVYARNMLEAGFTTCRDVGAYELIDVALKKAIDRGDIPGPRLLVSGLSIGSTGGHADITGFSPYLSFGTMSGIADGADEVRKKVRFNVKNGADLIKVVATAGVLSEEESLGAPQYTLEELRAIVDEAHMWGRKVAAHAHGTEGIRRAIQAGVDSIEHASVIDVAGIELAKSRGTFLVMDVYVDDYIVSEFARLGYPDEILEKEESIGRLQRENFKKAVEAGAKIAFGTDSGVYPHGWNAKQFAKMVEWGQTPIQALQSATIVAAQLLGIEEDIGSITAGKFADLIAVSENPLENISVMEDVTFVMKEGVVYKQNPRRVR